MRIAIYWEQDAWGGVDTQLLTLLREWPCATDQFILYYNRGNRGFHRIRENLLRVPNLRIQELASYSYNELVRRLPKVRPISWLRWCLFLIQPMLFLVMAMRLSIIFGKEQEIDLMLSDNGGYPAAWGCLSALLGARWAGIQTRCLLIHHSSTAPSPFMSTYERMIDRLVGKITSAVICVSYATRFSFLSRRNINEEDVRIRVVHNGISSKSAPFHTEVRFDIRAALELTDQMLVGIVGRIEPYKGHEDLIFALARLSDFERHRLRLVVLGAGDQEEMERLDRIAKRMGVQAQVNFLGYVPGDPSDLIAQLDLLVLATRSFEGFGLTLAEALNVETPILTTRVGAVPEFVDSTTGALVNPGSPLELSAALSALLSAPHEWRNKAKFAKTRIRTDGAAMAREYRQIFLECIAVRP